MKTGKEELAFSSSKPFTERSGEGAECESHNSGMVGVLSVCSQKTEFVAYSQNVN